MIRQTLRARRLLLRRNLYAAAAATAVVFSGMTVAARDTSAPTRIDGSGSEDRLTRRPTVRVEKLGGPGVGSVGSLSAPQGGLGTDLWRGARLEDVVPLMKKLPGSNRSLLLHDLQRRVLLTGAIAPSGQDQSAFTQARLTALTKMGAIRDVVDLASRTKVAGKQPYPALRARFLSGRFQMACEAAAGIEGSPTPFVEQAQIACHILTGDSERAEIAMRLLHEQRTPAKTFEAAVIAAAAGDAPRSIGWPYALSIALLRHSKAKMQRVDFDGMPMGALIALGATPGLDRQQRIKVLEQAFRRGAPVDSDLAILYAGASLTASDIATAPETRLRNFDSLARTRLYLAAASAEDVPKRLRILSAWWRLAAGAAANDDPSAEVLAARQTAPFLKNIKPSSRYQDHAAHIARTYFATGRPESALGWHRSLNVAPFKNPADLHRITAMAILAGSTNAKAIEGWFAFKRKAEPRKAIDALADLKALLEGLGRMQAFTRLWPRIAPADAVHADDDRASSYPKLREAAATGRRGMTILHVLTLINGRALHKAPRALLREAVTGLRVVGLMREARQLAIEAALARQL